MAKKTVMQNHHPDRELLPDYTIPLRRWIHLFVRRLEQFKATPDNLKEMDNVVLAVGYIRQKMWQAINKKALR